MAWHFLPLLKSHISLGHFTLDRRHIIMTTRPEFIFMFVGQLHCYISFFPVNGERKALHQLLSAGKKLWYSCRPTPTISAVQEILRSRIFPGLCESGHNIVCSEYQNVQSKKKNVQWKRKKCAVKKFWNFGKLACFRWRVHVHTVTLPEPRLVRVNFNQSIIATFCLIRRTSCIICVQWDGLMSDKTAWQALSSRCPSLHVYSHYVGLLLLYYYENLFLHQMTSSMQRSLIVLKIFDTIVITSTISLQYRTLQ